MDAGEAGLSVRSCSEDGPLNRIAAVVERDQEVPQVHRAAEEDDVTLA